jgi:hypothetical protein
MPIVLLDDVATHLNWTAAQTDRYAAEVQGFIDGASVVVESISGSTNATAYDEWHDGGASSILTLHQPILSITSVTETFGANVIRTLAFQPLDGVSPVDAYGYTFDPESGEITRRVSGIAAPFAYGRRNIHVVYQAGRASTPANIRLGMLELIRLTWWRSQQGGQRTGFVESPEDAAPTQGEWRMGFFVPNAVMEMLIPSRHNFGIA